MDFYIIIEYPNIGVFMELYFKKPSKEAREAMCEAANQFKSKIEYIESAKNAVCSARRGDGPTLIECKTYRHGGHSRTDPGSYRPKEEVEMWLSKDPLVLTNIRLKELGLSEWELEKLEKAEDDLVQSAAQFAIDSGYPLANDEQSMVFA